MARITMREAISQALWEEMEHDPNVFIMGEEVGVWGGTYAVTRGFYDHFGEKRVRDTPIAEGVIVGAAVIVGIGGGGALHALASNVPTNRIKLIEVKNVRYFI